MGGYYGRSDGSGGGSPTTYNQYTEFFQKTGPSSYATGGFVIDLTATYSTLNFVKLGLKKGARGSSAIGHLEYLLNNPANGKVTVKVIRGRYTRTSSFGNASGQPSGVTIQSSSGQTTSSESSHTHAIDHDHTAVTSGAQTAGGAGVDTAGVNGESTHTHQLDLPNFTGTSGAGASHNHQDNSIYQHQHTLVTSTQNLTSAEIANATNLSTTTWYGMASGVRA